MKEIYLGNIKYGLVNFLSLIADKIFIQLFIVKKEIFTDIFWQILSHKIFYTFCIRQHFISRRSNHCHNKDGFVFKRISYCLEFLSFFENDLLVINADLYTDFCLTFIPFLVYGLHQNRCIDLLFRPVFNA